MNQPFRIPPIFWAITGFVLGLIGGHLIYQNLTATDFDSFVACYVSVPVFGFVGGIILGTDKIY